MTPAAKRNAVAHLKGAFGISERRACKAINYWPHSIPPPYSPDFNPIENAFSKLKAMLRARAERTIAALWNTVGSLIDLFTPTECANYFKAAGYDPE